MSLDKEGRLDCESNCWMSMTKKEDLMESDLDKEGRFDCESDGCPF